MNEIPPEVAALPLGAAIIALVAWLISLGLPKRFAGLAAIGIAIVFGTLALVAAGQPWQLAIAKSLAWGMAIVVSHYAIVQPIVSPTPPALPPGPAPPAVQLVDGHNLPPWSQPAKPPAPG